MKKIWRNSDCVCELFSEGFTKRQIEVVAAEFSTLPYLYQHFKCKHSCEDIVEIAQNLHEERGASVAVASRKCYINKISIGSGPNMSRGSREAPNNKDHLERAQWIKSIYQIILT